LSIIAPTIAPAAAPATPPTTAPRFELMAAVVADDRTGDRAGETADRGTLLRFVVVVNLRQRRGGDEERGQERCDQFFHVASWFWRVTVQRGCHYAHR
jgi:hypothetical protein